ncbi:hypothetical protein LguiA_020074 [Lonicera macranthoides]
MIQRSSTLPYSISSCTILFAWLFFSFSSSELLIKGSFLALSISYIASSDSTSCSSYCDIGELLFLLVILCNLVRPISLFLN